MKTACKTHQSDSSCSHEHCLTLILSDNRRRTELILEQKLFQCRRLKQPHSYLSVAQVNSVSCLAFIWISMNLLYLCCVKMYFYAGELGYIHSWSLICFGKISFTALRLWQHPLAFAQAFRWETHHRLCCHYCSLIRRLCGLVLHCHLKRGADVGVHVKNICCS